MQAVALMTGDDFLLSFNLTIDTSDVLVYIKDLAYNWTEHGVNNEMFFDDHYQTTFAPIVGPSGICFNFNMVNSSRLFHMDK